ncbi:chemotaxis response regulator protein-glutamate methylesterase [Robbsia sp. Bb-Pol-6]|uniref:Protein-glutamate methylesterase/protein-glutamine glutaminase n=1 Tax=Robbsia betulipollinis TaxID=2981849 RepID=A0ABT3ZID2_9BURK|nr:chemotaxis response regulator protein-glutamate methylesterase [Robbsia betulipollinis]MCY0385743.1 chemotaxis response regulator protein-glutamate methylesterase [Robbsia betulipollinis]
MAPLTRRDSTHKPAVLVIDDSALMRTVMSELLRADPDMGAVVTASDPLVAMERMKKSWPDVMVLDIEMPRMDGLTFLRKIMEERPTPVIICSTLTERNAATTLEALAAGAVAVIEKPHLGLKQFLTETAAELRATVLAAARPASLMPRGESRAAWGAGTASGAAETLTGFASSATSARGGAGEHGKHNADVILAPADGRPMTVTTDRVVALGTSTGGTQALERVLTRLPRVCPGIVIVQHMPEKFTAAFATRLSGLCQIDVVEARGGERVTPGRALIAPGGRHMLLRRSGAQYYVDVVEGPLVNRHRPSVDVLFRSVAKSAGRNALGVIMTGMGDDGAAGLLEMRRAGARTLAQDEASCVVYGMPKAALRREAADASVSLDGIAPEILRPW